MVQYGKRFSLKAGNNGWSCESHECCGEHIEHDHVVRFKLDITTINGKIEEAIKAVRVRDGTEKYTIVFCLATWLKLLKICGPKRSNYWIVRISREWVNAV